MKIENRSGDAAVLAELGRRIQHARVQADLTQAALAQESGVSKRTVERLESGSSVQLTSLVRVLRTLALLDGLDAALPAARPGPMELLERGKRRERVRRTTSEPGRGKRWEWGDDA